MIRPLLARIVLATALALSVAGCAQTLDKLRATYDTVQAAVSSKVVGEVAPRAAIAAMSAYDAGVILATKWMSLPHCTGANGPLCRDPAKRPVVDAAVLSGRIARNNLKAFMRAHPGDAVPSTFYDAIVAASSTIGDVTSAYTAALK